MEQSRKQIPDGDEIVVDIGPASTSRLDELASVPIAYVVRSVFDTVPTDAASSAGWHLVEHQTQPYEKDYDRIPGSSPLDWTTHFDTTGWKILLARYRDHSIGAAALVSRTPGVDLLEGRQDLAVLWDIRVAPSWRGRGVGARLFREAEAAARTMGLTQLKIETQNVNVPACRFYIRMGCTLAAVDPAAYPDLPTEVQMLWRKNL